MYGGLEQVSGRQLRALPVREVNISKRSVKVALLNFEARIVRFKMIVLVKLY
jgi:hypothetical protein